MTKDEAKPIVWAFRDANPELVQFGKDIFNCAADAVRFPGTTFKIPPLNIASFTFDGHALRMRRPNGAFSTYWHPRIEGVDDFGSAILTAVSVKGPNQFRRKLWSGIFCENLASGSAVDLLGGALVRFHEAKLPVVLHVHDSIAAEVREQDAPGMLDWFRDTMAQAPDWTRVGSPLPVNVDAHISPRFG